MLKRLLFVFLFCIAILIPSSYSMDNINFAGGFVSDGANVIRFREKNLLNLYLRDLQKKTTSGIAVVTLPSIGTQRAEERAMYINKAFRVGGYGKDNGVVVVIVPEEKKIAIYTGYNVEDAIPDIRKKQIIEEVMLPEFDKKFYTKGIYDGLVICIIDIANYYGKKVSGLEYKEVPPMPKTFIQKITPINWTIAILFLFTGILLYYITKKPEFECYPGFGGDFRNIDEW
ncbi:TPM domain-containing protein [bacterium]|nr:TPM domain-containing protein [bacterium]